MSEHDEQRPMTRRERRLREMEQAGAAPTAPEGAANRASEPAAPAPDLEISPYNEDGSLRSRAEMRALRAQALAASGVPEVQESAAEAPATETPAPEAQEPAAETAAVAEPVVEAPVDEQEPEASVAEAPEAPVAEAPLPEALAADAPEAAEVSTETVEAEIVEESDRIEEVPAETGIAAEAFEDVPEAPPTQPFSLEDVFEAENGAPAEAPEDTEPMSAEPEAAESPSTEPANAEPEGRKRFSWRRNRPAAPVEEPAVESVAPAQQVEEEIVAAPAAEPAEVEAEVVETAAVETETVETEAVDTAAVRTEVHEAADTVAVDVADIEAEQEAEKSKLEYSFPDIQPPEEWRSVFDDPASRSVDEAGQPDRDFDTLIERAVAQEGAAASTNSAALIMPTHPEDTGGLAGPLGSTGELFITGSIELPQSLAETGGHSELHDSIKMEPVAAPEIPSDLPVGPGSAAGPVPVSAKSAVSARASQDMAVVAKPAKESSKLPMILTVSGGVLLAAVAGLGVWGWMNGMFG